MKIRNSSLANIGPRFAFDLACSLRLHHSLHGDCAGATVNAETCSQSYIRGRTRAG